MVICYLFSTKRICKQISSEHDHDIFPEYLQNTQTPVTGFQDVIHFSENAQMFLYVLHRNMINLDRSGAEYQF